MQMYYSASTGGFYCRELHGEAIPEDAKQVDDDLYRACVGRHVIADSEGMPTVAEPVPLTFEQRAAALLAQVDRYLDATAQAKGYDSRNTFYMRAAAPLGSPFQAEGVTFAGWMDAVYAKCYEVLALVKAQALPEPDWPQLLAMLPALSSHQSQGA